MDLDLLEVSEIVAEVDLIDKDDDDVVVLKIVVERAWKRNLEWKGYNPKLLASLFPYPGFSIPSNPTCKGQRSKILI